jgi:hypothetical protein
VVLVVKEVSCGLLLELRRIVVFPVTVLGLICGIFCSGARTSGGPPGGRHMWLLTRIRRAQNPRLLVSLHPLGTILTSDCEPEHSRALPLPAAF